MNESDDNAVGTPETRRVLKAIGEGSRAVQDITRTEWLNFRDAYMRAMGALYSVGLALAPDLSPFVDGWDPYIARVVARTREMDDLTRRRERDPHARAP